MTARRLLSFCLTAASWLAGPARAQWTDQTIESVPEFALTASAMQVDDSGVPHVFVGGDRVYHYWLDGAAWRSEVVDPMPRSGERLRAALGSSGEFHLIYERSVRGVDSTPGSTFLGHEREYATNLGGSWHVEPVSVELPNNPGSGDGYVTGLGVDPSHQPRIFVFGPGAGLFLASRSAAGWSIERVDADPLIGAGESPTDFAPQSQLAVDAGGRVHAIWFADSTSTLIYSLRGGAGWTHTPLLAVGDIPGSLQPSALLVDPGGHVHVFAQSAGPGPGQRSFLHLSNASGSWLTESVDAPGFTQYAAALQTSGQPALVSSHSTDSTGSHFELNYTRRTDQGWVTEPIDDQGPYGQHLSLRVDSLGHPHVATLIDDLFPDTGRTLLYFHRDSLWTAQPIGRSGQVIFDGSFSAPNGEVTFGADVRIGLVGGLRRLLYRTGSLTTGRIVRHASEQPNGAFALESLPFPGNVPSVSPRSLALAVAPDGRERALWTNFSLIDSVRENGAWTTTGLSVNAENSRRPAVEFRPGFFDALFVGPGTWPNLELRVLQRDSEISFTNQLVTPVGDRYSGVVSGLAIAPGPLGSLQVAYLEQDVVEWVKRASNASGQWLSETVGQLPLNTFAISHSLVIEPDGSVHLAYERGESLRPSTALMYGSNRCHGFAVTEVDPLMIVSPLFRAIGSKNPDLVLDSVGNPHISYRRDADMSLGYAHVHDGRFVLETVVADTYTGENSAIAIDADRVVSIAHHDPWAGDLRLATREPLPEEPRWDGCAPLGDPNAALAGRYYLVTPPGALPLYDPGGAFSETYGAIATDFSVGETGGGKLLPFGEADADGDGAFDSTVNGSGAVSGNGREIKVKRTLVIRDLDPGPPSAKLNIVRSERIDPVTRQRTAVATFKGKLDGRKLKGAMQSAVDLLPAEAFGMSLVLDLETVGDEVSGSAYWLTRGGPSLVLAVTGTWSAATQQSELRLKGKGVALKLSGVRIWRNEADGTHLRCDAISGKGLGQKVTADLSSAF
jgi:hypothetical protein